MKLGTENRRNVIIMAALLIIAAVMLYRTFAGRGAAAGAAPALTGRGAAPNAASGGPSARTNPADRRLGARLPSTLDPTLRLDLAKVSESNVYKGTGRNIFLQGQPPPEPIERTSAPVVTGQQQQDPGPAHPPPPPPINLKFYGYANQAGEPRKVFFSQGEDIFLGTEGEVIQSRYRILRINPASVEVEDILNNYRQTLPLQQG